MQTAFVPSFDCDIPHAMTAPGALNHVEVYVTQTHVEVWTSDTSPDGVTFPNLHLLWAGDVALPFSRGYVSLALRNHATMKYWLGSAAEVRWDNVGFDGPVVTGWHDYSAPDSLSAYRGLPGCAPSGGACQWEGDVIPANPGDSGRVACAGSTCNYDGEGRNVGYVVPNVDENVAPVALPFSGVALDGATRARLVLAAIYPWFEWNGVNYPPTHLELRFRVNGGAWHDRFITAVEANAFTDFSPDLGGAGAGAGLLNQAIDLDLGELRAGDNLVELLAAGTWTGTYRVSVTGADLVLDARPLISFRQGAARYACAYASANDSNDVAVLTFSVPGCGPTRPLLNAVAISRNRRAASALKPALSSAATKPSPGKRTYDRLRLADRLAQQAGDFRHREIARPGQLAHDHAREVRLQQRVGRDDADVGRGDGRHRDAGVDRAAVDPLVLDQAKVSVAVLVEVSGPQDQQRQPIDPAQPLLGAVQADDRPVPAVASPPRLLRNTARRTPASRTARSIASAARPYCPSRSGFVISPGIIR